MKTIDKIVLSVALLLSTIFLMAQPQSPPATPIDGGLGVLLAGGAAYGLKKLREARHKRER